MAGASPMLPAYARGAGLLVRATVDWKIVARAWDPCRRPGVWHAAQAARHSMPALTNVQAGGGAEGAFRRVVSKLLWNREVPANIHQLAWSGRGEGRKW